MTDAELCERARATLSPRKLSKHADSGGVACALVTCEGSVYVGVCIVTDCSMGFCAEHNAIGTMVTNGESTILTMVAVHKDGRIIPPCGRCREFIFQVNEANATTRVLLGGGRVATISELLPDHWAQDANRDTPHGSL
ncbi:MAG: cytidine deaminase family protein [Dehalococcoidia bacterium]